MPSLEQLQQFQSSFKNVGSEAQIMSAHQLPLENVVLPGNEPPAPFPAGLDLSGAGIQPAGLNPDDLGLDLGSEAFGGDTFPGPAAGTEPPGMDDADFGAGDFDFSAFLESGGLSPGPAASSGLPDIPGIPDMPDLPGSPGETDAGTELPGDLLSGFADDLETGGLPADTADAGEDTPLSGMDMNMDGLDLDGLNLDESPDAGLNLDAPDADGGDVPDMGDTMDLSGDAMDLGGESPADDFSAGLDLPGFDEMPGFDEVPAASGDSGSAEPPDTGLNLDGDLPDLGDVPDMGDTMDLSGDAMEPGGESSEGDFSAGLDMSGFDDMPGFDETPAVPDSADGDAMDLGSEPLDMGGEALDLGSETLDLGGDTMDLGGEALDLGGESSGGDLSAGFDLPGFDETPADLEEPGETLDLGTESLDSGDAAEPLDAGDSGGLDDAIDLGGDMDFPALSDETPAEGTDAFDAFNPGGEAWTPSVSPASTPDEFNEFSLAGFDDFAAPGASGGTGPGLPGASEEVEEIQLNEGDFKKLQDTLSAYPLNLRVACEELIAEKAVAPDLMSALVKLLVRGAPAKETAALAGKILDRPIPIPRGYAKQTGAELEAEQASFGYIFVHSFLPVLRLFGAIVLVAASLGYLVWRFAVIPLQAEALYKDGYSMLQSGAYIQANERFMKAVEKHRVKNWYYRYAEGFRDERQYIQAQRKYDELLRYYPRDKKGALDYAALETYYLKNYEKADRIIRNNILDYTVNDREGLIALAENNLALAETKPERYEEARAAYARLMEKYGRQDIFLEGMLKYFIRTDNLDEVLPLQAHFMGNPKKRKISVPTLAELGAYLLDKKFEQKEGVPDEYADQIEGIRDVLLRAVKEDGAYPESYYHLARYYNYYGSAAEERHSLEMAVKVFAASREETSKRAACRVDAHRRYAEVLINAREFFPAEEELVRGIRIYEDARARQVLKTQPEFGRLYANLGDLEFFVKDGNMAAALRFYEEGERNGWAPPEIQYRMGAAHYQMEQWEEALERFFTLTPVMPGSKRLLYAMGNVSYMRGNYFAAQSCYNRLMDLLSAERVRFPNLAPGSRPEETELAERLMTAQNNLGVTLETLTRISGDTGYRSRALGLFAESIRAWDVLTRDPGSMARMRPLKDLYGPGVNLAYLNAQNILHPEPGYEQRLFMRIDRDALESSPWENLVPRTYRLSDQLLPAE